MSLIWAWSTQGESGSAIEREGEKLAAFSISASSHRWGDLYEDGP